MTKNIVMARQRVVLSPETKELLQFVRNGHLFEIENWVKSGKPLRRPEFDSCHCILSEAVKTGFHSMVKVVLECEKWSPEDLGYSLALSIYDQRVDIAELLLEHGAPVYKVNFDDIGKTMDLDTIRRFIRLGLDPCKRNAFARFMNDHKAKPSLRIYMSLRQEFPDLDRQASLALCQAIREKNLRWTSLLSWAGADPLCQVPYDINTEVTDTEAYTTNAATEACSSEDPSFLRILKITPDANLFRELLNHATWRQNADFIRYLLKLGASHNLNDEQTMSCKALESLIQLRKDSYWWKKSEQEHETQILNCIEMLLDRGARWNPPDDNLSYSRRGLYSQDSKYVVQVVRLLLYTPGATPPLKMWKFCNTAKLRLKIMSADAPLWQELLDIRNTSASDTPA